MEKAIKPIIVMILFHFLFSLPLDSYASEEFYTIQTGSFITQELAQRQFDPLTQKLAEDKLDFLRIEKVKKYYTVRLGKFSDILPAKQYLQLVTPHYPDAVILKAYILDERIIKTYGDTTLSTRPEELKHVLPTGKEIPDKKPEILLRIRELVEDGDYKEALALLSPFLSDPMRYPAEVSDYIVILVWDRRLDEAIKMYKDLPAAFPRHNYLLRNIARAYYDKKDFFEAASLYKASLKRAPLDEEAQKGLVFSLIQTGDFDSASAYLNRFLKKAPDSFSLKIAEAYLKFWQGRHMDGLRVFRELIEKKDIDIENIYKSRDDIIASLPAEKRQAIVTDLHNAVQGRNGKDIMDYILVLILNRDYRSAVRVFETSNLDIEQYPDHLLYWIAWAYFKTGDIKKAKLYYKRVLDTRPHYVRANIGLAYCLVEEGDSENALTILDKLLVTEPDNLEVRFARAYVYESSRRFLSALQEYDYILGVAQRNQVATRLRLFALSDLGISSYAHEEAQKDFPRDMELLDSIKGDMVVDRLNWDEYGDAVNMLQTQLEEKKNLRARYDYIMALTENSDMAKAVEIYEELVREGASPPPWVLENVAGAYLYLEQPYKALELYDKVLEVRPNAVNFKTRLGKFYVLQELRKWDMAQKVLDELDQDTPQVLKKGKKIRPNWPKADIKLAKGWFFLYKDQLKEAEEHFWNIHEMAPANTNFRTGLAYTYLWRGWPRKALKEFKISTTLDPKDVNAQIGKIYAMNALQFREQARKEAQDLLELYPKNKYVQRLVRRLKIEEMRELITDFVFTSDDEGFEKIRSETQLSQPVSLYTRLFGFLLWQKDSEDDQRSYFHRTGLGLQHIFNNTWKLRQHFSVNYDDADDFGSFTEIDFTPDDYLSLRFSYDSFTTTVPIRARVFDIEADNLNLAVAYRESDWRRYHLSLSRQRFSDDNERHMGLLGYEQGLWIINDWKMRLFIDLYMSTNSRDDVPYFSPDNDFSLSVTHLTEHRLMQIYRRSFIHRLYFSLGTYKQSDFSHKAIGSVRYEHDINFSEIHSLLYGINLARQVFDGEAVTGYSFYLTWRLLF